MNNPNHSKSTSYRPLPPREYALGSEIRRTDASFVPTLQSSSSLRRSGTTGSQYSWSSRSGSQNREGRTRTGRGGSGSGGSAGTRGVGGGLSSININTTDNNSSMTEEPRNTADEQQENSAMGRISEEDASGSVLLPSRPPNLVSSQETLEIFERSDMFNRSESDSVGSKHKGSPPNEMPNPDSRLELDTMTPLGPLPTIPDMKSPESISTMGESIDPNMEATARFGRLLQQCRELTQTLSESTADGATKSSKSEILQQAATTTTETFEPMKLNPKQTIETSTREHNTSEITMDPPLKTTDMASVNKIQDSSTREGKSLISSVSLGSNPVINNRRKSLISELSMGVDQMYNDTTEPFQQESNANRSPYRGSPVSELSYSGRQGDDIIANLSVKPVAAAEPKGKAATVEKDKPAFMKYLSKIKTEDIDTRSWLSDTDGEPTPKGGFTAPVPISGQRMFEAPAPIVKQQSQTNTIFKRVAGAQPKSPQSSFLSTDFSDEGDSGGLLVDFGKRRKGASNSSSSSSSGSSESSDSTDNSDSSSSSESQSGEITDETEPRCVFFCYFNSIPTMPRLTLAVSSYPTIARSGIRLNHQDDDVSALSFGGASALVASAPSRIHLAAPALPPPETCNSESSSTPSKSLKSQEVKKESSPESEESKKSSKSTGSGLVVPPAGVQRRRSSLSGAETFSVDTCSDAQNTIQRRSTFGDLPQLEEEAESQASSISPGMGNEEVRFNAEAIISGQMSRTSNQASLKSSINAESSLKSASRLSKSSRSTSPSSKLNATGKVDSSSQPATISRLPKSSSENSAMEEQEAAEVLHPSSAQLGKASNQTGGQHNKEKPTYAENAVAAPIDQTKQPTMAREESKVCEYQQLGRVAEDSSDVQDFVAPLTTSHFPSENTHPNEYPKNSMVYDDEISVASSLSSVVSKARVSFQMSCAAPVISGLSDRSREETKSKGSFRKSASDMIAERQSSKASLGSKCSDNSKVKVGEELSSTENQLDSSAKSGIHQSASDMIAKRQGLNENVESSHTLPGTHPQLNLSLKSGSNGSGGDLFEGFPHNVDDGLIRRNRKETTQFHSTLDATDEIDARRPWRTSTHRVKSDEDSTAISDAASSTNRTPQDVSLTKQEPHDSDVNSALSVIITSTAALMVLGDEVDNIDVRDKEKGNNPCLLPKESSSVVPKHHRRSSTEPSITEWDFSDQNKTSPSEAITYRKSPSVSMSSEASGPTIDTPSPTVLAAAAEKMDGSSQSITADDDALQNQRLSNEVNTVDIQDEKQNQAVKFDLEESNGTSIEPILLNESSPLTKDKRELYRKSMLDTAHEMSVKLDNFFLSRSQQQIQVDDFESRSFEDLSSASEEDNVLAFLRDEYNEEGHDYSSRESYGHDVDNVPEESLQPNEDTDDNNSPEDKLKPSKSRATTLHKTITTRIRSSVMKPPEDDASEDFNPVEIAPNDYSPRDLNGQDIDNVPDEALELNEDTNDYNSPEEKLKPSISRATSLLKNVTTRIRSSVMKPPEDVASEDFIAVEIAPILPEVSGDDSDGPPAHVTSIDIDHDEHDEPAKDVESGFVFPTIQEDNKENSDSAKGQPEIHESSTEQVEANQDKAYYRSIVDFFRSKHFLIALGCFVLVIIIVVSITVTIGSKDKQAIPSLQPTIEEEFNPPSPPTPSIWVQGKILASF